VKVSEGVPRWKRIMVSFIVVYPTLFILTHGVAARLNWLPSWLQEVFMVILMCTVLSYAVPALTKLLSVWPNTTGLKMTKPRTIVSTHAGSQHGPITRLIDPSELGEKLKPFIFLDFFNAHVKPGFGFGMHPHSGIATLTWQPSCDVRYQDTTGENGVLKAGGLEWMNAGGGAWHQGSLDTDGLATGFQLWVPMPPTIEDGESFGQYIEPGDVPKITIEGATLTLMLGQLLVNSKLSSSPIDSHQEMSYFVLDLIAHSEWNYAVPPDHDVAWAFVFEGDALVANTKSSRELLVIEGEGHISFTSNSVAARILIGSARKHPHDLVLGSSSVHTNAESLRKGHERIRAIGNTLTQQGLL
jgi:redox-sensitive bicupin YhaK (pirin superfamily)